MMESAFKTKDCRPFDGKAVLLLSAVLVSAFDHGQRISKIKISKDIEYTAQVVGHCAVQKIPVMFQESVGQGDVMFDGNDAEAESYDPLREKHERQNFLLG